MNKVILIGRLTRDPELRFTPGSGNAVTRFTIAAARPYKREEADFISCVAFGKTAETIAQYFTKGTLIAVNGNIRTGSYKAQDGTQKYTTDVVIESFEFVQSGKSQNNTSNIDFNQESFDEDMKPVNDEDMPF